MNSGPKELSEPRHLVSVWNPSYASNAMEEHLRILLTQADRHVRGEIDESAVYVWWGKVRSSNRQQAQAHRVDIRALENAIERGETHLYLTDYRSLYVADLDEVFEGELPDGEAGCVPAYYREHSLNCDFWFRVVDIRRLVADDLLGVIEELKQLRNVHYNDRPVSLYGGMVDLPLIVTRPDHRRYFDSPERDAIADFSLWARWDAEHTAGLGAIEADLRDNLFGASAWRALEPLTRTFTATAEQIFRAHRGDPGFDFAPVLGSFSKALEVQCNAILRRALASTPLLDRQAKVRDATRDITQGQPLSIGELARVIGGERRLNAALLRVLEPRASAQWFAGSLPAILDAFADIRNPGTHAERVDGETATRWRDQIAGVGCSGHLLELARLGMR
jgi:hypothetical protein